MLPPLEVRHIEDYISVPVLKKSATCELSHVFMTPSIISLLMKYYVLRQFFR
jgi:hypothetical protein